MTDKIWTIQEIESKVVPLLKQGWSVNEVSRSLGISRQRLTKILVDNGYSTKGDRR